MNKNINYKNNVCINKVSGIKSLNIKLTVICAVIICLCCLASCSHINNNPKTDTPSYSSVSTAKPTPTSTPFPKVKQLSCINPPSLPTMVSVGDNKILISSNDYNIQKTYLDLVDVETDTIIKSAEINGSWNLENTPFSDGTIALLSYEDEQWLFMDKDLNQLQKFSPTDIFGVFSHDRSSYYFLKDNTLYVQDVIAGFSTPVSLEYDISFMSIIGLHPTKNAIVLSYYLSSFDLQSGTAIIDLDTNKLLMLTENVYETYFSTDSFEFLSCDENASYTLSFSLSDNQFRNVLAKEFNYDIVNENDSQLTIVNGSDYVIGYTKTSTLFKLGDTIMSYDLSDLGIKGAVSNPFILSDSNLIAGSIYNDNVFSLFVLNPDLLNFTETAQTQLIDSPLYVNQKLTDFYWGANKIDLPESLNTAREYANQIEEKYSIKIHISSECSAVRESSDYSFNTTDEADLQNESEKIITALDELDNTLSLYPDGFFKQFKTESEYSGIRFFLVEQLKSDFGVIGEAFEIGQWQNIVYNMTIAYNKSVICHEIWHATENEIVSADPTEFDFEAWNKMNPEGFSYSGDPKKQDSDVFKWTLYGDYKSTGLYFIDEYAKVNDKEDRARIMEYVMAHDEFSDEIIESPTLLKKYEYMINAINKHFDTTDWSNVYWERFSNK